MTHTNPTDKYIEELCETLPYAIDKNGSLHEESAKIQIREALQKHRTEVRSEVLDEVLGALPEEHNLITSDCSREPVFNAPEIRALITNLKEWKQP